MVENVGCMLQPVRDDVSIGFAVYSSTHRGVDGANEVLPFVGTCSIGRTEYLFLELRSSLTTCKTKVVEDDVTPKAPKNNLPMAEKRQKSS